MATPQRSRPRSSSSRAVETRRSACRAQEAKLATRPKSQGSCRGAAGEPRGRHATPIAGQTHNIRFSDAHRLMEALGFRLERVSGSHQVYGHPHILRRSLSSRTEAKLSRTSFRLTPGPGTRTGRGEPAPSRGGTPLQRCQPAPSIPAKPARRFVRVGGAPGSRSPSTHQSPGETRGDPARTPSHRGFGHRRAVGDPAGRRGGPGGSGRADGGDRQHHGWRPLRAPGPAGQQLRLPDPHHRSKGGTITLVNKTNDGHLIALVASGQVPGTNRAGGQLPDLRRVHRRLRAHRPGPPDRTPAGRRAAK